MKISGDAGHNCSPDTGAVGYKKEDVLTKEVWTLVQSKLKSIGIETVDCTPYNKTFSTVTQSLSYRVSRANASNSNLHLCIHFNAGGGHGVECYIVGRGGKAETYAKNICKEISNLGYTNRGVKVSNLYVPKYTLIQYISNNKINSAYVTNATNCIIYDYSKQWKNGSTTEVVYETSSCSNSIGSIDPYEKATPLYRENGVLHVVYDTDKGEKTKSGYVKYNDSFTVF